MLILTRKSGEAIDITRDNYWVKLLMTDNTLEVTDVFGARGTLSEGTHCYMHNGDICIRWLNKRSEPNKWAGYARIGIDAPREFRILRSELSPKHKQ